MSGFPQSPLNHDRDDDSLFGSPPQSPLRGRSPSPLALPSGTAQNVGTLALPGSHLVAELPVTPPASLPLSANASTPCRSSIPVQQPTAPVLQPRPPLQPIGSSAQRNCTGSACAPRANTSHISQKGKERERRRTKSTTPRPTPPPIPLPSADELPPPNFFRNQQALLGLAGMVGGVNPANLAKPRTTRGTTAENPIVVEDEPPQPFIGKRVPQWDPSQFPRPTSEQILSSLLRQKNVLPVVVSLLRLLVPGAPSLAAIPHNYPPPQPSPFFVRSQSPESTRSGSPVASVSAPPLKRRKLNSVPAGAADWDVPYPFQDGQGPENYRSNWEHERSKQLLADLVQLVRSAAQKAGAKAWYQQKHYGSEPRVNKYYRPKTMLYGLEHGPAAPSRSLHHIGPHCSTSGSETSGASTPRASTSSTPLFTHPSPNNQPSMDPSHFSSAAFDQLIGSLLEAEQYQQDSTHDPSGISAPSEPSNTGSHVPTSTSEESTQAFFDSWLEMLAAIPPGDPNDPSVGSPAHITVTSKPTTNPGHTSTSPVMTNTNPPSQIPDCLIDPALLDLNVNSVGDVPSSRPSTSATSAVAVSPSTNQPPVIPSLVHSPAVTTTSLTDAADVGPATPSCDWTFPDAPVVPTSQDMKLLEQWAGMDVDVDISAFLEDQAPSTAPAAAPTSTRPAQPSTTSDSAAAATDNAEESVSQPGHALPGRDLPHVLAQVDLNDRATQPIISQTISVAAPRSSQGDAGTPFALHAPYVPPPQLPSHPHVPLPHRVQTLAGLSPAPAPFVPSVAHAAVGPPRGKGKAKAIPGTGNGVGGGSASAAGQQDRKAIVERARVLRAVLAAEVERAKVALWETTLEQGVLVAMGRELEKKE